jgi:phosphatidate cytidylyltransferase
LLLTRVITAVVLLVVLLGMLFFASAQAWSLFMLAVMLVGCWEWSRMSGLGSRGQSAFLFLSGAIGTALWLLYARESSAFGEAAQLAYVASATFWVLLAPAWLKTRARPAALTCAFAGWLVIWPTWFAFVQLRDAGPWLLLAVSALVWIADISAYFAGHAFGRHKLAPAISPGKTWEGVYGGLAGVVIYGLLLLWMASAPISIVFRSGDAGPTLIIAMLVLTVLSIEGDLFESWMKRGAGMKDSSGLLPGHGGVLDRIDALTSTLPMAAFALAMQAARP